MCACVRVCVGGLGTPTDTANLSLVNISMTHHSVFRVIQKGSLAGLFNRGILTFQTKAKVNIRKPFFWSAAFTATIYQLFLCAKHPLGALCTFLT